jgi:hypothetical protein
MQSRYVADIGDFAKYGLLRALTAPGSWRPRLAVLWYLVPDETHNEDGRHIQYLSANADQQQQWMACDSALYGCLKSLVDLDRRSIWGVQKAGILPGAVFHGEPLAYKRGESLPLREKRRAEWLSGASAKCEQADVVFLDPDNGLEVKTGRLTKKGPKYVYFEDLHCLAGDHRSLIIYQHTTRQASALAQIRHRLGQLKDHFPRREPFALRFRRVSSRAFLIVPSQEHERSLRARARLFLQGPWNAHFELVEGGDGSSARNRT